MKKILCLLMALVLFAVAAGCGTPEPEVKEPFDPAIAQSLIDAGVFSAEMMEFDHNLLFQLPEDAVGYQGSVVYFNVYGISEVVAVMCAADEESAAAVEQALSSWVETNKVGESNYRPAEAEKLENAILETRGNTVLLVVAADAEKANSVIFE